MTRGKRHLAAIIFSDICNFSRVMHQDEKSALKIKHHHEHLAKSLCGKYDGRIIKKLGDGLLLEFESAINAVSCSARIQKEIQNHNRTAPENEQYLVRIGIHLGDVVLLGSDILGDGVNIASRIQPLADPGGICISSDILNLVRNRINMETSSMGMQELKNIERKINIYKILAETVSRIDDVETQSDEEDDEEDEDEKTETRKSHGVGPAHYLNLIAGQVALALWTVFRHWIILLTLIVVIGIAAAVLIIPDRMARNIPVQKLFTGYSLRVDQQRLVVISKLNKDILNVHAIHRLWNFLNDRELEGYDVVYGRATESATGARIYPVRYRDYYALALANLTGFPMYIYEGDDFKVRDRKIEKLLGEISQTVPFSKIIRK